MHFRDTYLILRNLEGTDKSKTEEVIHHRRKPVAEMYCTVDTIFGVMFSTYERLFPRGEKRPRYMTQLSFVPFRYGQTVCFRVHSAQ
jgi:hypothetical protein